MTLRLPRALEWLINDANLHVPAHVSTQIPCYRLRAVHGAMQRALGAYMSEARLNWRLLINLVERWQARTPCVHRTP